MIRVHVSIASTTSWGYSCHLWSPIPGGSIPKLPYPEPTVEMAWPHGATSGSHKLTATVRHSGQAIVLDGHDCGPLISHWFPNFLSPEITIDSSRSIAFSASTVRMNALPVGATQFSEGMPMTTCGWPCAMPTAWANNGSTTVFIGCNDDDLINGWIGIASSMVFDIVWTAVELIASMGGGGATAPLKIAIEKIWDIGGKFAPITPGGLKKLLASIVVGWQIAIVKWHIDGRKGPLELKIPKVSKLPFPPGVTIRIGEPPGKVTVVTDTGKVVSSWTDLTGNDARPLDGSTQASPHRGAQSPAAVEAWGESLDPPNDDQGWVWSDGEGWVNSNA